MAKVEVAEAPRRKRRKPVPAVPPEVRTANTIGIGILAVLAEVDACMTCRLKVAAAFVDEDLPRSWTAETCGEQGTVLLAELLGWE